MILITGASGYVGSHLTRRLVELGLPVRAMVYNRQRAEQEGRLKGLDIEIVEADVTRPETLAPALAGVTAIIHTVAIAIEKGNRTYETFNYQGTANLVDQAQASGVKRFIFVSQLGARPDLPYRFLASKGKAEAYVKASGLDWTCIQPSAIWGPEDEFANSFARLIPLTPLIFPIVGDQNSRFQLVWVEDVVSALVKIVQDPDTIGKVYELGGPEILTLEEIERRTLQAIGRKRWLIPFPMPILRLFVALLEWLLPNPPVTRSLLELLAVSNVTTSNSLPQFVAEPRPFKPEYTSEYMRRFTVRETLAQFFKR